MRDIVLPLAVMSAIGMMILPLGPFVLDMGLSLNICLSLLLLLSTLYLSEPEKFTALPSLLLLSTLFRLGLNVATTRQILTHAEAPSVVEAFGNFVVEGNVLVGAVVFLIITVVQFLVIAKGAERVAEVAARFTLDAMPGKQMSIDADIRAGILSLSEAREKRLELQSESKLYGALDGAMKFVKGDAIAGLIIITLNLLAGFVLGVCQHGLSLAEAARRYTLFTVGDGLVSQMPALLTATAAGVAVTRVGGKAGEYASRDMLRQLGNEPQGLLLAALLMLALALMPGLPAFNFLLLGALLAYAYLSSRRSKRLQPAAMEQEYRPKISHHLSLRLGVNALSVLKQEGSLPSLMKKLRSEFFETQGLLLPEASFEVSEELEQVEILFKGVKVETLLVDGPQTKDGLGEFLLRSLRRVLERYKAELIDDTQTRIILEAHQGQCEDLINQVVPKLITVTALTKLLRALVEEGVSVCNLAVILQAVSEYDCRELSPGAAGSSSTEELLQYVRIALRRSISHSVTTVDWKLKAWVLAPELDRLCGGATVLNPDLVDVLEREVSELPLAEQKPVLLSTRLSRRAVWKILKQRAVVLAVDELSEEVQLEVLGEINLPAIAGARESGEAYAN